MKSIQTGSSIIVLGVSGSGKSTIAERLAVELGGEFLDADTFHPPDNIRKMSAAIPLLDVDRFPWLEILAAELQSRSASGSTVVLACSALKRSYRSIFREALPEVRFVFLKGSFDCILQRMNSRQGHFMKADLLRSQFSDLEEPDDAIIVSIEQPVEAIIQEALVGLQSAVN